MAAGSRDALSELLTPNQPGPEQQDAPLSEEERKLVARLFSDPTYFPVEFRTWIRSYLETSDIRLPSSAIVGGNAPRVSLPAGIILPFAGSNIPSNCLMCNGAEILRADYDLLFQAIGLTWGSPSSGSVFKLPDLRDRALYGAGNVVGLAATDGRAIGSRGGPIHRHSINQSTNTQGSHSHGVSGSTDNPGGHTHGVDADLMARTLGNTFVVNSSSGTNRILITGYTNVSSGGAHTHNVSGGTDTQGAHSHNLSGDTSGGYDYDKPSYAGVYYIIATGKNV